MFGIAWLDTGDSNRYIYCNNITFSSSGDSDYSSPFLFMFKRNASSYGTVTFSGSGNFRFYDINKNINTGYVATHFNIYPNTETFKYGILYIGNLNDGTMEIYPLTRQMDVNSAIATAIGNISQFEVSIVTDLPTTNIDTHTIYFVSNNGANQNIYDEYMYINSSWEKIGTTDIDLSNYLQTTDIAAWAKSANKPTYTASEVGALPDTTTIPTKVSDLTNDSGYITSYTETDPIFSASAAAGISSTDISNWNAKSDFSGSYNDLSNKPTIPAAQVQSDWNATSGMGVILNKPTIPAATIVTQVLTSGTLIATINGTNIYAPTYTDADGVSY